MVTSKPFTEIDLRSLAELSGPERAFVSLYLSGPEAMGALDHRIRHVRGILSDNAVEQEHFDRSMELIQQHFEEEPLREGSRCIFASWALDFLKAYKLTVSPRDRLWVDSSLYLRPLAELQDEYEGFAVVAADNSAARIFLVASNLVEDEQRVRGGVKNHVKKGGWSQQRYERRRDNELLHYAKEVVERLVHLAEEEPFDYLVLVGSDETMQAIEKELPQQLAEKLVGEKPIDLDLEDDSVWRRALGLVEEAERESEEILWERIKAEYLRGGLAVVGPEDVLGAAAVGRVEKMIVTRDAKILGTQCRECTNLMASEVTECAYCGSEDVFTDDLVNELVELLATSSAETEFSDPISGLSEVGDIAALLRY
ncbi:MAG: hypothetical protein M3220_05315 [Chloroflexota bacterium]|nr:hypothetical protein [Chloroflexota bacterium]